MIIVLIATACLVCINTATWLLMLEFVTYGLNCNKQNPQSLTVSLAYAVAQDHILCQRAHRNLFF